MLQPCEFIGGAAAYVVEPWPEVRKVGSTRDGAEQIGDIKKVASLVLHPLSACFSGSSSFQC